MNLDRALKKRILIPIMGQGSILHIIRSGMLEQLSEVYQPVVVLLWEQLDLMEELKQKNCDVYLIPSYIVSENYSSLRNKINLWYKEFRLRTPSFSIVTKLRESHTKKQKGKLLNTIRRKYYNLRFKIQPAYIGKLIAQEDALMKAEPCYNSYYTWLKNLNVDGLFTVTPFLPEVDLMARILREQFKPMIASIHSFDNVTKRGWQSTVFDEYIVWNKYNRDELFRIYPHLKKSNAVTIAGAPQFDFHYNDEYVLTKKEWLKQLNLPEGKKVILYAGGISNLTPTEPQYTRHIAEAIEEGLIKDAVVLFRNHPLDKKDYWIKNIGDSPYVHFDAGQSGEKKNDHANVTKEDIKKLISTLRYTDVHINICSTMAVDGSTFNKAQIGPYYDEVNPAAQEALRGIYEQEHYLPILKTNVIQLASSKQKMIDLVNEALAGSEKLTENCKKCVEEIITYTDGQSAHRAVAAIKTFFKG